MTEVQYSFRKNDRDGCFEVVRYEGDQSLVVQYGIRDSGKAQVAVIEWRRREAEKVA